MGSWAIGDTKTVPYPAKLFVIVDFQGTGNPGSAVELELWKSELTVGFDNVALTVP